MESIVALLQNMKNIEFGWNLHLALTLNYVQILELLGNKNKGQVLFWFEYVSWSKIYNVLHLGKMLNETVLQIFPKYSSWLKFYCCSDTFEFRICLMDIEKQKLF